MSKILRYLVRKFFNLYYKIKPPESVEYYKRADTARAKIVTGKNGEYRMEIEGEKHSFPGFPRGYVLTGPLAKLKKTVKNMVFNQVFAELEKMVSEHKADILPVEKMPLAVQELGRVLDELEHAEVTPDMKGRIKLIKKVLLFFFSEDDAYRLRFQWCMERFDMKKVKLSKEDLYYFRAKYFKPDKKKRIFGVDFDAFDY